MNVNFKYSIVSRWYSHMIRCCHRYSKIIFSSTAFILFNANILVLFVVHCIPAQFCLAKLTPRMMFLLSSLHTIKCCFTLFTPNIKVNSATPMDPKLPPSAPTTLGTCCGNKNAFNLQNVL